jgi:hypothetical protein
MANLFLSLVIPSDFNAPQALDITPLLIVEGEIPSRCYGDNSIVFTSDVVLVRALWRSVNGRWERASVEPFPFNFNYFTRLQREETERTNAMLLAAFGARYYQLIAHTFPLVAVLKQDDVTRLYHFNDMGPHGSIYVCYHTDASNAQLPLSLVQLLRNGQPELEVARRSVNDACHHGRWRQDLEFERKFTFPGIPDTWHLINELYSRVRAGELARFVPEVGLEFQVYDYEVCMFEVLEPAAAQGYIAFIDQANGRVCVKQKWFKQNAEIRKETLTKDVQLQHAEFEKYAVALSRGKVKALPTYRRKRFDVNFESLDTGNVYGIFFDICRTVDGANAAAFSQCEVEYCRSRTFGRIVEVFEQFEIACGYAERFLREYKVEYRADLYSKLDFVRSAA